MKILPSAVLVSLSLLVACGDDSNSTSGSGGSGGTGSTGTTTSSTTGTGGQGTGGSGTGGSGTGTGGSGTGGDATGGGGGSSVDVPCGEAICSGGDYCLVIPIAPACTPLDEGNMCPEGTTETQCGGAGLPCCCGETPPPETSCVAPEGCEGEVPSCACLVEPCEVGRDCVDTATPGEILCEELPEA